MSVVKIFNFTQSHKQEGYLSGFCEDIFRENDFKEELIFQGMPERMAYESEIWMIGEKIRQELTKLKKIETELLLAEVVKVISTTKYGRGRESFVMILHYFGNSPTVEKCLSSLLDDVELYGYAIKELNKLRLFTHVEKVREILQNEKTYWIKKEAERYLKNSKQ